MPPLSAFHDALEPCADTSHELAQQREGSRMAGDTVYAWTA